MKNSDLRTVNNHIIGFVVACLDTIEEQVSCDDAKNKKAYEGIGLGDRIEHKPNELSEGQQ